jgi:hypothetical protein
MALHLSKDTLKPEEAEEINDEYEIKVISESPEIRNRSLGRVISALNTIAKGHDDCQAFEAWCLEAIKICFAGKLDNIQLHPNKNAVNRRDIIATNVETTPFWERVRQDYGTRQVIFEVKNYEELTLDDYRQMQSYLSGNYGRIGFFITRANDPSLEKGKELNWFKMSYDDHGKTIVKLTAKFLVNLLSKLRNPQKHDAPDASLSSLLDTYERNYLGQHSTRKK